MSFATTLLDLAVRLMPLQRRDWAEAMRREGQDMIGAEALEFATGCLWAALQERIHPMQTFVGLGRSGVGLVTAAWGAFHLWCLVNVLVQLAGRGDLAQAYITAERTHGWLPWMMPYLLGTGIGHLMAAVFLVRWRPGLFWCGCLISGLTAAVYMIYLATTFGLVAWPDYGWQFAPLAMLAGAAVVLAWLGRRPRLTPAA